MPQNEIEKIKKDTEELRIYFSYTKTELIEQNKRKYAEGYNSALKEVEERMPKPYDKPDSSPYNFIHTGYEMYYSEVLELLKSLKK